jgi:hypothetical protein
MTFTVNLTVGSRGADVSALQAWLISKGGSIPAGATGFFGAQTQAALAAWQAANGVSPAAGYFGPITRAKVNAMGGTGSTGGTGTTGSVSGLTGSGRLTSVSSLGDVTSDIKVGDSATQVVGVSGYATDGDVLLQRVDATLVVGTTSPQSANLNKYVSDVSVYLNGTKLGSMNPADGDKDGTTWTLRFANLNGLIKKGTTGNLYVKVTPLSTIGSNEDGKTVTARLLANSLRAVGADGISETYIATGIAQAFTVSSQTTGTLTVSAGGDNPVASQVAVSSSTTTGVKLLTFTMKAKNTDIDITDLAASFGTSDNNLNDVISTVKLMHGSTVLSSKTVGTGTCGATQCYQVVTFDNVNQTISKDSTESYSIVADFKGDASYADNTTVIASTTTSGWDVSDTNGATVTPSAAAVGNTMTVTATGLSIALGTITTDPTVGLSGAGDTTQYTIPFTITAGDNDIYIGTAKTKLPLVTTSPSASAGGLNYATTSGSTFGATGEPTAAFTASNVITGDTTGAFKVGANTSRTFTFTAALTATTTGATTSGFTGVQIVGVNYGPTSTLGTTYFTSNLDTFKTGQIYMTKR